MQSTLFDIEPYLINPKKKENTLRFYEAVRKEYLRLRAVKKDGVRLYSNEYILHAVGQKFYRSARTVENIVFGRV